MFEAIYVLGIAAAILVNIAALTLLVLHRCLEEHHAGDRCRLPLDGVLHRA
jgi:hypothetical protein